MGWIEELKFDAAGLVPVVAQDARTGTVLMLAYADREALERTVESGRAHFWSRSRKELWEKGATSGNVQNVVEVRVDCDGDAILYRVEQTGPACHTGETSCFHRLVEDNSLVATGEPAHILARMESIVRERDLTRTEGSYTSYLFESGLDKILKKIGEEATEVVIAAKNEDRAALSGEAADLLFHLMVLLRQRGAPLSGIWEELEGRFGRAPRLPRETSSTHTNS
ncbi:MAG: bifunctional phosphoribosyl-AMP cyclohydrolase/phosphoribosyl-ATP diphosphatase HisIE [Gemmatimonadetes bacterium]|nr:bifunctional phosphoribosyl-AMP cyclohydrolase/phosphoribosyl-ATP diphosphatase HisIE [Gemmatimonadota bacterium]